jgi:iron complex outermembrane receptor protein
VPTRSAFVSFYVSDQTTRFDPNVGSVQLVDARTLGFQDVLDAQGNVVYPAEAFLYGGRSRIVLPANLPQYEEKQGNPRTQLGMSTSYQWNSGAGVSLSGNYFSDTCTGRLCTVRLPGSYIANVGAFYDIGPWTFKLDVVNVFNERYFRARTGDTLGNVLAQAMPDRRWQATVKVEF